MVLADAVLEAILAAIIDTGGPFDPADTFLGVATAIDDLGPATVLADVTEATGAMATRVALGTFGAPYKLNDGCWVADAPLQDFFPLNSSQAQTLVGYFLTDALVAGLLKGFDFFDAPVVMPDENYHVTIVVRVTVDPSGKWSQSVVWNG